MKFACDKCQTKYSIADERVKGRVLKIRCKSCNHVITVREDHSQAAPLPKPPPSSMGEAFGGLDEELEGLGDDGGEHTVVAGGPPPSSSNDSDEWYVSFDGEQEGPFPLLKAVERVRQEQPRGKEIHCWRPGFFVWLPLDEVPDFTRALKAAKPPPKPALPARPPIPAAAAKPSPARPSTPREPTGSAAREPAKHAPVVKKDPTGPRAALSVPKEPTPLAPLDSKPMPLPPPPEAPAQLSAQVTKPETASAYRRATGSHAAIAKGGAEGPSKRQSLPSLPAIPPVDGRAKITDVKVKPADKPKPADPSRHTGPRPAVPSAAGGGEANGFAAALTANAGGSSANAPDAEVKTPDTGPVPLPPPPGDELPIGEASGLLNLSHLKPGISGVRPSLGPVGRAPVETFGGVPVTATPTPGSNGANGPSTTAPVVVVAGPAPASTPQWMKYAAIAGIATTAILGCVVVYLVTRPPVVRTVEVDVPSRKVDDAPIAMADPAVPGQPQAANDPKKPAARHLAAKGAPTAGRTPNANADPQKGLSSAQRNLASLYGEDTGKMREFAAPSAPQHKNSSSVSESALANVVQQNKPAMGLCYQRVLKHDPTLKSAKMVAHVKIGISGRVTNVSFGDSAQAGQEIGQCLSQSIKRWNFPASDSEYDFEFPIVLTAQ